MILEAKRKTIEPLRELASEDFPKEPYFLSEVPVKFLKHKGILPLSLEGDILDIAVADPDDVDTLDALIQATGYELRVFKATADDIREALLKVYESDRATVEKIVDDITPDEFGASAGEDDVDHLRVMASEAPVIRLVNLIFARAIENRASDIHFEPFEDILRVRFRIDDLLSVVESLPLSLHAAVSSRVKIMANLNIAERRLPQDGRIKMAFPGRDVDIRVSTVPTSFGESVVLRILDRSNLIVELTELGLSIDNRGVFEKMIAKPYGMVLVTGPTGSGKTTTLYTTLDKLNSTDKKIVTIEDPVEYNLFGINQIQVKPRIGLSFATGLRHILRHDPNIVMVGEIRDTETAEIAVQSALTGHMVFSTLHTNDAAASIVRMLEMGVHDYLLASSLIGIIAQRLVRVICDSCKETYRPGQRELEFLAEVTPGSGGDITLSRGKGCEDCAGSGYRGRIGIFEVLPIDDEIGRLILKSPETSVIKARARELGMVTLREDGIDKAAKSITTLDEVMRVTCED
ncbi:MAG: type II secretion system ATPase GspE [Thermodesulfobacteriota bacterium]